MFLFCTEKAMYITHRNILYIFLPWYKIAHIMLTAYLCVSHYEVNNNTTHALHRWSVCIIGSGWVPLSPSIFSSVSLKPISLSKPIIISVIPSLPVANTFPKHQRQTHAPQNGSYLAGFVLHKRARTPLALAQLQTQCNCFALKDDWFDRSESVELILLLIKLM